MGKQKVADAFHKYHTDLSDTEGFKEWKEIPYKGVRTKGIHHDDLVNQRYIGKQSHMQKWYLKVVRIVSAVKSLRTKYLRLV